MNQRSNKIKLIVALAVCLFSLLLFIFSLVAIPGLVAENLLCRLINTLK